MKKITVYKVKTFINKRSIPERIIILGSASLVLFVLWEVGVYDNISKNNNKIEENIYIKRALLGKSQLEVAKLEEQAKNVDSTSFDDRIIQLKKDLIALNQKIGQSSSAIIPQDKLNDLFEGVMNVTSNINLTSVTSIPVESLNKDPNNKNQTTAQTQAGKSPSDPKQSEVVAAKQELYRYGISLEFTADYKATVNFLQKLEQLPWMLFFDSFSYEVAKYPNANVILNIKFISDAKADFLKSPSVKKFAKGATNAP